MGLLILLLGVALIIPSQATETTIGESFSETILDNIYHMPDVDDIIYGHDGSTTDNVRDYILTPNPYRDNMTYTEEAIENPGVNFTLQLNTTLDDTLPSYAVMQFCFPIEYPLDVSDAPFLRMSYRVNSMQATAAPMLRFVIGDDNPLESFTVYLDYDGQWHTITINVLELDATETISIVASSMKTAGDHIYLEVDFVKLYAIEDWPVVDIGNYNTAYEFLYVDDGKLVAEVANYGEEDFFSIEKRELTLSGIDATSDNYVLVSVEAIEEWYQWYCWIWVDGGTGWTTWSNDVHGIFGGLSNDALTYSRVRIRISSDATIAGIYFIEPIGI